MAYGIQVPTVNGMMNVSDISALKVVWREVRTTISGSVTLPASLLNKSLILGIPRDDKVPPEITYNPTNGNVNWAPSTFYAAECSSNFYLTVLKIG